MAEATAVSSFDEQFEEFKKQFIASHPTIASCPRALSAHIGAIDAELDPAYDSSWSRRHRRD